MNCENLLLPQKGEKILIVSHDAGGAEVLSSWVKKNNQHHFLFVLEGAAITIFQKKIGMFENHARLDLKKNIEKVGFVITSTGWASDLEREAVCISKACKKPVAAYLDHWINYRDRFVTNGKLLLPDFIWVGDLYALEIAKQVFPEKIVKYVENEYFLDVVERGKQAVLKTHANNGIRILFVSQPIEKAKVYPYTEFDALHFFLKSLSKISGKFNIAEVAIRLHPTELRDKYTEVMHCHNNINMALSSEDDIVSDCLSSDWVVGCFSMAQVVALHLGKKVFSCVPDKDRKCLLPHKEILCFETYLDSL